MKKTGQAYLEHVNFGVKNIHECVEFIRTALPDFRVRGGGESKGRKWLHIGTDKTYLALNEVESKEETEPYTGSGLNHFGFVVDDVEAVAARLEKNGYRRSFPKTVHKYRVRDYFVDHAGNEFEFVQYLSDDPAKRNEYSE